jgi:tripartite-type tricarboxylate transporter receptor subunit TctC
MNAIRKLAALRGVFLISSLVVLVVPGARAEGYPDKAIRIVVPFAVGGGVDNITRVVGTQLSLRLKQPVIVDNRPGANANIGTENVVRSAPDGYTLLMGATYLGFNRATVKSVPYDALRDLVPVARAGVSSQVLVVPATSPIKSVAELAAFMRANPTKSFYGSVAAASPNNLIFNKNTGTHPEQVLYKGGAAAMPDLLSGRLTYMLPVASEILSQISSGRLRALAVVGPRRLKVLPDVPTMAEAGVPGLTGVIWWGLFAPAKTPQPVVDRVATEMQALLKLPEVAAAFEKLGIEPAPLTGPAFTQFYRGELKSFADVAREFNLTSE